MRKVKDFQELTIGDDFMFGMVMANPENNICKEFLEALLHIEIDHIDFIDRQMDMSDDYSAHGVRLDVFVKDAAGTIYNVEMQTTKDAIEKRARYYQSGIDRRLLLKSQTYHDLKNSYIIFVCNYDHYGLSEPVYQRYATLKGHPDVHYEDGSHLFVLNSRFNEAKAAGVDHRILDFLHLVNNETEKITTDYARAVKAEVDQVKKDPGKEEAYMTYSMRMQEERRAGEIEGRKEGRTEGAHEEFLRILCNLFKNGIAAPAELAKMVCRSTEEVEDGIAELQKNGEL